MATYKSFMEFPLWDEAVELAADIYKFCETGSLRTDYRMKDQIRSAACSISNNIAEGFEYDNPKSFIQFLLYSKGSACEVYNQLTILSRAGMITAEEYSLYSDRVIRISRKIGGLIQYLRKRNPLIRQSVNPPMP
jgi:four helix bundle protein